MQWLLMRREGVKFTLVLLEDKAQKEEKHTIKNNYWKKQGIEVMRYPLPVGDYIIGSEKVLDVIARKKIRGQEPKKMDFLGTYDVCVDSKFDIQELISDICGKQHDRFRDEAILAQNNGIKLYILVENKGGLIKYSRDVWNLTITKLEDLHKWANPRLFIRRSGKQLYPSATRGITLQKACYTMQKKYGCEFIFCTPEESGKKIIELLEGKQHG